LTPGFTSYHKRLQYQTYDVTDLIDTGDNAIGALLGEGWYSGVLGDGEDWSNKPNHYGEHTGLLAQLEVTYQDGTSDRLITDESWKSSPGPILMSGIYAGETYDARLERSGWDRPGFDDAQWSLVKATRRSKENLIAQSAPPVRKLEEITPRSITRRSRGETIVDMGQNMVGWVRLSVHGPAGTTVTLRHGEMLDPNGNLYAENLGKAAQTIRYTLKGQGEETYEPHFTYQGFRYVAVEGYPGELTAKEITGVVVHSDVAQAGEFESSSALLNQLQHNIVWAQRGNFVDIPTDCPQRDERLGWTGDAQIFASTAAFNADVEEFFEKWLKDLAVDQYSDGSVPWVIPDVIRTNDDPSAPVTLRGKEAGGTAGWGDAATVIPWALYLAYGNRHVLEEQYASMSRWVEYERKRAGPKLIWSDDFQYGDWMDVFALTHSLHSATSNDLVATAYFAHSADLLARVARVLSKSEDAARYGKLFEAIRAAFERRFVSPQARVGEGTQTAYALALQFGLLRADQRAEATRHLVEEVRRQGHLTTGFLGTPELLFALSDNGHLGDAYRLLNREAYPSWLYEVKRGATTIWERWDGVKPDGALEATNSFNHYAYGAVGEWLYRVIAGINIDPSAPGYKHIVIEPHPGGALTSAKASHLTPYGKVSSSWYTKNQTFHLVVEIPPNTTATVALPQVTSNELYEGDGPIALANGIFSIRTTGTDLMIDVGSGRYDFNFRDVRH
jgi:alpha-L-rhamnosidase